jgi:hypothetical protein
MPIVAHCKHFLSAMNSFCGALDFLMSESIMRSVIINEIMAFDCTFLPAWLCHLLGLADMWLEVCQEGLLQVWGLAHKIVDPWFVACLRSLRATTRALITIYFTLTPHQHT